MAPSNMATEKITLNGDLSNTLRANDPEVHTVIVW